MALHVLDGLAGSETSLDGVVLEGDLDSLLVPLGTGQQMVGRGQVKEETVVAFLEQVNGAEVERPIQDYIERLDAVLEAEVSPALSPEAHEGVLVSGHPRLDHESMEMLACVLLAPSIDPDWHGVDELEEDLRRRFGRLPDGGPLFHSQKFSLVLDLVLWMKLLPGSVEVLLLRVELIVVVTPVVEALFELDRNQLDGDLRKHYRLAPSRI